MGELYEDYAKCARCGTSVERELRVCRRSQNLQDKHIHVPKDGPFTAEFQVPQLSFSGDKTGVLERRLRAGDSSGRG
jgi:hypothetical protein